ncbi:TonB family protein [Pleomorphomonas sp. JP5]|uniref:TonB family protein n=1 Tax=Pleomorphomonas sp. JP5 TaxID=2942998 RepID=UPI0020448630|nr:TonB family protein [Pleomorphomonas sp. JP5]MCM5559360.1 TonB family protein [Pleomorphomonas sp. JP5]
MSDSDVCLSRFSETTPLAANPWCFATAVSLGLHAAVFMWIGSGPKPIDIGLEAKVDVVNVEFVLPSESSAVSPSATGSLATTAPQQVTTAPPPQPATEQTPSNDPQPKPVTVTTPPETTPVVIEKPPPALVRDHVDAEAPAPRERPQPPLETKSELRPVEASAPHIEPSPAEAKSTDHPAPIPKPVASQPKRPPVEHQAEDRKPPPAHQPKSGAVAKAGQAGSAKLAEQGAVAAPTGKNEPLALYLASIRAKIAAQQSGRPSAERGRVEVRFSVAADGRLGSVVVERSDDESLEDEALKIVRRSSPVAPIPPSTGKTSLTMSIVMEFK